MSKQTTQEAASIEQIDAVYNDKPRVDPRDLSDFNWPSISAWFHSDDHEDAQRHALMLWLWCAHGLGVDLDASHLRDDINAHMLTVAKTAWEAAEQAAEEAP